MKKIASEIIAESLEKEAEMSDKETGFYTGTVATGLLAHNQVQKGNLTGRETLYHGTPEENVSSIKEKGILASKANDPESFTRNVVPGAKNRAVDFDNLTYLGKNKSTSQSVNLQRAYQTAVLKGETKQHFLRQPILDEYVSSFKKHPQSILKAKVPVWKKELTANPELLGTKNSTEFLKKYRESNPSFSNMSDEYLKKLYNMTGENSYVFKGNIEPEFIKGSKKYKGATAKEISEFIKSNPKRFAKGSGAVAATGLLGGLAVNETRKRLKQSKIASEIIDALSKHQ